MSSILFFYFILLYTCNIFKVSRLNVPSFLPFMRITYCKLLWIGTVNISLFSINLNVMLHHFNEIQCFYERDKHT